MFEGARRIALALAALWVVGCVAYAAVAEPYASATYAIPGPGEPPAKAERCAAGGSTEYTTVTTRKGHSVGISLCFPAWKADDGRHLIPYAVAPWDEHRRASAKAPAQAQAHAWEAAPTVEPAPANGWLMNEPYSREVSAYTRKTAEQFTVGATDMESLEELRSRALFAQWKSALQVLAGGLVFGWVLITATGWIVRGFLGVPRGKDARPAP
jgi:hypothetical protein